LPAYSVLLSQEAACDAAVQLAMGARGVGALACPDIEQHVLTVVCVHSHIKAFDRPPAGGWRPPLVVVTVPTVAEHC